MIHLRTNGLTISSVALGVIHHPSKKQLVSDFLTMRKTSYCCVSFEVCVVEESLEVPSSVGVDFRRCLDHQMPMIVLKILAPHLQKTMMIASETPVVFARSSYHFLARHLQLDWLPTSTIVYYATWVLIGCRSFIFDSLDLGSLLVKVVLKRC